jgi:hypothetical protein
LETDLNTDVIEYYSKTIFENDEVLYSYEDWYDLKKISDRNDKTRLTNYILKQKESFNDLTARILHFDLSRL